jgi:HK97 family phage portal protein
MNRLGHTIDRIARRFGTAEARRSLSYQDVWATGGSTDMFTGAGGVMSLVPLFAAIRLITDQFAATPIHGYRSLNGVPQQLATDPQFLSPTMPSSQAVWKTQLITGLLTRGNAVGLHTAYGLDGYPTETVWVNPQDVQCMDDEPDKVEFFYLGRKLDVGTFVHIPWVVLPGRRWGLSPLGMFKTLWETGQAAQELSRNFYDSGGVPSGHLKNSERELDETVANETKLKFKMAVAGRDVLVTGNDWEYNAIGLPADQLAFVASLKLTATQIASIYGIAPEDIGGEAAAGLQYSTVEMNDIKLTNRTMRPWYTRVQDGLFHCTPRGQYVQFNPDALVSADLKTRMEAHEIALRIGLEDQEEARADEDKAPMTPERFSKWRETYKPVAPAPVQNREVQP